MGGQYERAVFHAYQKYIENLRLYFYLSISSDTLQIVCLTIRRGKVEALNN